mmetsp:Transcript_34208/g.55198  ORF Transcript_34208/g.55198 Transcript_34208/m.55198 type:complete len:103 (+) Transcript_34208:994-1302(+)
MYDPLKYHDVKAGMSVAIVGCGGLGSMGLQLAKAMGATATAISTSPQKEAGARKMGADHFLLSTDAEAIGKAAKTFESSTLCLPTTNSCRTSEPSRPTANTF